MTISLRPSEFSAGGGLIDDVDVNFTNVRFCLYDYDGTTDPALSLRVTMVDTDGEETLQYYSAGDKSYFVPSEDPKHPEESGKSLVQVGEKTALNGGCNTAIFLTSVINAGFDEGLLGDGDVSVLEGLNVHVNRVPQAKRSGLATRPGQKERERTIVLVTKINEAGAAPKKAAPKTTAKTAAGSAATTAKVQTSAKPAVDADLLSELEGELIGLFASKDVAELKKVEITKGLFATIDKTNPNRAKLMAASGKEEFLNALDGFTFDGSVLAVKA